MDSRYYFVGLSEGIPCPDDALSVSVVADYLLALSKIIKVGSILNSV